MFDYKLDKSIILRTGFNPYYKKIQSELGDNIIIDNKSFINLASNNYLGLANDKRIKAAAVNAINKYGLSLCGTPIATGYNDLYKKTEDKISNFLDLGDALIFSSCYQANNGLFSALVNKNDVVFVDHFAHSSLIQGIKGSECRVSPFLHNNITHLESLLKNTKKGRNKFVVTESVFSTQGDIAPFNEINELCNKYQAMFIIDDSHGIGVIGKKGKGIIEYDRVNNFSGIYTASLGKAIANAGGVICGEKKIIEYLRYNIAHLIYSTAITPSVLGGILRTFEIIEKEYYEISTNMRKNKKIIYNSLKQAGFDVIENKTLINSIKCGDQIKTIMLAKYFYEENILVTPFIEPSVPKNRGVVRLIIQANLDNEIINELIEKIGKIGKKYNEAFCNL